LTWFAELLVHDPIDSSDQCSVGWVAELLPHQSALTALTIACWVIGWVAELLLCQCSYWQLEATSVSETFYKVL
jgi:hypothetical protein